MSQWGSNDAASNSVLWAPQQLKTEANTTTRDALFGNTTANAFISGETIGQYGVDANEIAADFGGTAHTGWVLRKEGSGGRAGRVMTEVLVAGGMAGDAEDVAYPDYSIVINTQPADASGNSSADDVVTFSVVATTAPTGGSLTYLWQYTTEVGNTDSFATTAAVSGFADQTTATLSVDANTIADGTEVRAVVSVGSGDDVTSSAATLTVTS